MAKKKYKNFKIEQEELKPITIGAFESRKKTSIGIFIILTIFVLVVIFLPQISNFVDEYLNEEPTTPAIPDPPSENPNNEDPDDGDDNIDETFYAYTANLRIDRDNVVVSNILIDPTTSTISYSVTNNTSDYQDMEALNYYLEIYNSDRTLIERIKLVNTIGVLASGAYRDYTRTISSTSAGTVGYLVLVSKTTADYPEVTLTTQTDSASLLVCTNAHEEVTYEFVDNELKRLTSNVAYLSTDTNYQEIYSTYQATSSNYNLQPGLTSSFFNSSSGFNITTIVDLEEATRTYIFNADSFTLNTEPKVVNFEMEALGYACN